MPTPLALQGSLALYQTKPYPLPYFETNGQHPNKLIFLAGLTDTIGVVPYLPRLASALDHIQYALVQPIKGSDLGGFGLSSLEGDAQEIAGLIQHLTTRQQNPRTGKLVVMGHSTGCQDVVQLLSQERSLSQNGGNPKIHIDGGILQAPASDHDYFEANKTEKDANLLAESERLIGANQGSQLLPRNDTASKPDSIDGRGNGNADAVLKPAFTAYRYQSLNGANGDDDFFSDKLTDQQIYSALHPALVRAPLLMLIGENDEYVPKSIDKIQQIRRYSTILKDDPLNVMLVPNADHKVNDAGAQEKVCDAVIYFLGNLKD
ncbi:hypothetical protein MYAM1_000842 [Malassezia yamatoensis]|uniref:DUF1749-domain-containing protein n=1 Tax=Malassezia yamatoensis TaxID=253288 RepID=A0AAJ5YPI8_9BASI|nr:hypothetical protein MYAM1_000842 [Malassezia yamatoensis]